MRIGYFKILVVSICTIALSTTLTGCVIRDLGQTVEQTVKGDYFLESDQSRRGRESFRIEIAQNPDSALAHYYYGRFLLQENENMLALEHLATARDLEPAKADYQFWTGLAFGVNGIIDEEEMSYRIALSIEDDHLQSLIYLGHNQFSQKKYAEALQLYYQALEIWPASPSALYNRALILKLFDRTPEERIAWLDYLDHYPSGPKARQATDYLNLVGDFSFRNQTLGTTTVTVEKIRFIPFTAELDTASNESLLLVGNVFQDMQEGTLQIVVYQKNNKELAKQRAIAIKAFLGAELPLLRYRQIGVSWFAEPQTFIIRDRKLLIEESVSFFVTK